MKRRLFGGLFALLLALLACAAACAEGRGSDLELTESERAYIDAHGVIRVGYVQDRVPVSFIKDGQLAGISRYIFDRIERLSGLTFQYVPLPAGEITYDFLVGEKLDLVTSVEYNKENVNARGILISQPYLSSRKVVVAREGLAFSYGAPLKVAVSTGSQTLRKVLSATYPNFTLEDYDSITDCFEAVRDAEADVMIQNQYVVEYWISKPAYEGLRVIPALGLEDEMCFSAVVAFGDYEGVSEEDGRTLIDILNKSIDAMSEDEVGSYTIQAVMENQYEFDLSDILCRYRYAVTIFCVAAVLIVALAALLVRQRIRSLAAQADARAKGQFLSAMSHEIRTPLNGLIGLNYLISKRLNDHKRVNRYLQQSTITAKYLLGLVNDILDMNSLQEQQTRLSVETVDLALVVSTAEALVQGAMAEKQIDFTVRSALPYPYVTGDAVRIQQVMLNLLDNARKFTPEGGKVTLTVGQNLARDGRVQTCVEIADNGRGMSEAFQRQVFDSFAQEKETVSAGNQGTGLGLPISRKLARLMDGDITFSSRKGEGSQFYFTFMGEPEDAPQEEEERRETGAGEKSLRVLVAEDNELNGEIMTEVLEGEGFEVVLARDGQEALDCFRRSEPYGFDVILMDLLMPKMNGYEAAAAIRALEREDAKTVYIVACTANTFAQDRDKAFSSGMDDFLSKPVDVDELLRKIASRGGEG